MLIQKRNGLLNISTNSNNWKREKTDRKTNPVLLRTSIAGAKAPTPGNIRRLAFRMSFGVCTCSILFHFSKIKS